MNVDVGTVVAGKYELVRLIGKGAMGEVWLARHDSLGGEFAVKLVETSDDAEAETATGRFQLEAQIAAKLSRRTRHIVSVSDHGEHDGFSYLVMELLEGESLEARLKRAGRLDLAETVAIVMQVSRALGLAHEEGIFHRDLKPANIFLSKDEDGRLLVKLLDFGIARAVKPFKTRSPFATSKDMVLGTPSYMSPEQARGLDSLDHRCDLWALSTCAFEALAQRIPFDGATVEDIFLSICTFRSVPIASIRPDLPPAVGDVFTKAFAPKIDARFATAQQLAAAFEALVDPSELAPYFAIGGISPSGRQLPVAPVSAPEVVAPAPTHAASSDPVPAAIDTLGGAGLPKRNNGVMLGGGALAVAAVIALAFFALRGSTTKPANAAPNEAATTPVVTATAPPIPPPPQPAPEPTTTATPTASAVTATPVAKKDGRKAHAAQPHAPATPPVAAAPAPSPSPSPSPAPSPAPAKKGPHDKGEVF